METCSVINRLPTSDFERAEKKIKTLVYLVHKTLAKNGFSVSIAKHTSKEAIRFVRFNELRIILLAPETSTYLYNATSDGNFNREGNNQFVSNIYDGPCGVVQIFAARDNFDASGLKFGSDPAFLFCTYDENGPKDQFLFMVCVPLRVCSRCYQDLQKSYKCSRCRAAGLHVRYCSRGCQEKHWPLHKAICGGVVHERFI